jgi:photosynthetic reaction center cytochrome c subunit
VQRGFRGIGMEQVYNRLRVENTVAANVLPEPVPETEKAGQRSSEVYQNVQVLGDVDANEFIRIMTAITAWVSPEQGCAYCHNLENMADGSLYTYQVARRMIQMTRHTNADWKSHVGETGVTCYTCHRGQPVPNNIWFNEPTRGRPEGLVGNPGGQNSPATSAGLSSLPYDPFTPFLTKDEANIRVASREPLPNTNRSSIKQTEWTMSLMAHFARRSG